MRQISLVLLTLIVSFSAQAVIDVKNANYSDSWIDIIAPGTGFDLRIQRTYNSRTLFNGMLGFGWCSDFETKIDITPDNTIKLTECGGGLEIVYSKNAKDSGAVKKSIEQILAAYKTQKKASATELKALKKKLVADSALRNSLAQNLKVGGKTDKGVTYKANGKEFENIVYDGKDYTRTLADGTKQVFNKNGHLVGLYDKNRNYLKINRKGETIKSVVDNNGRQLNFKFKKGKLVEIVGPNKTKAQYKFNGENLVAVTNMYGNTYTYEYDNLHNLTKINYPDNTSKILTYNQDKDWVTSFTNRKKCKETYDYKLNPKDPYGNYSSEVVKVCDGKVVNKSKFEFFYKDRPDGQGKYLQRVITNNNGKVEDTTYHELFGKPIRVSKNGVITTYNYYENGFLRETREAFVHKYYEYKNKCEKVSLARVKYYRQSTDKKKPGKVLAKTSKTAYKYDEKRTCNLIYAQNNDGMKIRISYDSKGRIDALKDQAKKVVTIKYDNKYNKPSIITRPGLGSIKLSYRQDGSVNSIDSKDGREVSLQVVNVFNNLLEVLGPATSELAL